MPRNARLAIRFILLTHAHIDHITGVPAAKKALGVPIYLHRDDLFLYERGADQAEMYGFHLDPLPPVDHFYKPGEVFTFGEHEVRWHHTPGHCPGGVCLQVGSARGPREDSESSSAAARASGGGAPRALENDLFVGDTLFAGSIGRTDFAGGDMATLMASIRNVLFAFGDDARVHPGHGPSTTIGRERRTNPFLVLGQGSSVLPVNRQDHSSDLQLVAPHQLRALDPLAVDVGAVPA